jgi:hypothetical protein
VHQRRVAEQPPEEALIVPTALARRDQVNATRCGHVVSRQSLAGSGVVVQSAGDAHREPDGD